MCAEECKEYLQPYTVSAIDNIAEQYWMEGDADTLFSALPL